MLLRHTLSLLLLFAISIVWATPELVIENDDRKIIEVAEFGFLPGGRLTLQLTELNVIKTRQKFVTKTRAH
jgi:hypothetical protein